MSHRVGIAHERNVALLAWYATQRRSLPWRESPDAYAVLVSEFMLQQTQASRVVGHYERFMERFPTVRELAAASLGDVLELWSGLGYNTRAQRLRDAARHIAAHGWPETVEDLEQLPGVGPYTAAAIASFAFGAPLPAIDTNLRRVLSRWHGEPLVGATLEHAASADIGDDAAMWNQAVMDLGAMVCKPRVPRCDECPVQEWCTGPDVYVPPRPQSRFEGSFRQMRGAVIRSVVRHPQTIEALAAETGIYPDELDAVLGGLIGDGLIIQDESTGEFSPAD